MIAGVMLLLALPMASNGQPSDDAPRGEFAVTIAAEDIPPELIGGASLIGRWRVTFGEDGAYVLSRQDVGSLASGHFESNGERLTLLAETGVLACGSAADGDTGATYEWDNTDGRLLLVAIDEPCALRRLLMTTRILTVFVACPPLSTGSAPTPARPTAVMMDAAGALATPGAADLQTRTQADIESLLGQLSDCWATREPERFLQLLSAEYAATQRPEGDDAMRRFTLTMGAPVVWDLAGDVTMVGEDRATASVRQTLGDTIDTLRYAFVMDGGVWRWDGLAEESG